VAVSFLADSSAVEERRRFLDVLVDGGSQELDYDADLGFAAVLRIASVRAYVGGASSLVLTIEKDGEVLRQFSASVLGDEDIMVGDNFRLLPAEVLSFGQGDPVTSFVVRGEVDL